MKRMKLYEQLEQLQTSDQYPFHMPGHKRQIKQLPDWNLYGMDITEIDGFDNLHDPQEILKDTMEEIAEFRGAEQSYMLINGSSCGLLAAISACVSHGDSILLGRNCHKAVYHAIYLNALQPFYSYPQKFQTLGINGGILSEQIEKMLITYPSIRLVVVTSPTYEGVVSDIEGIVKIAHERGVPVLVDQAHGAHFGMGEQFPKSAVNYGADLVVESVHKTLPALTQTALLHVQGKLVDRQRLQQFLGIYQTSSPSYPLMAGIAWCMDFCKREQKGAFLQYEQRLNQLRGQIRQLECIRLFSPEPPEKGCVAYDKGKLVFGVKEQKRTGMEVYQYLRTQHRLQMEMATQSYCIAMTSVMDTEEGLQRLYDALKQLNEQVKREAGIACERQTYARWKRDAEWIRNTFVCTAYEVEQKLGEYVPLEKAAGRVAKSYVYLYPPGIPLVVPGERIQEELPAYLRVCIGMGLQVKGPRDGMLSVVREDSTF